MEMDLFWIAIQSSFILGLIHGVNPCGHSWVVLAPFVAGSKEPKKVTLYTISFVMGTTIACLIIGATLGMVSTSLPPIVARWLEYGVATTIIILGLILIVKPHLLHSHDHDDDSHDHHHEHEHKQEHNNHTHSKIRNIKSDSTNNYKKKSRFKAGVLGLFGIGFVNMIIPCPTLAIMYSYAIESKSVVTSLWVFLTYALSTGLSIGFVIFSIYKITTMMQKLQKSWIEGAVMRTAGVLTVAFGLISLFVKS